MIEEAEGKLELVAFHRSMTFEEERAWAYSKKDEWDLYAVTETAEKKGRAKGEAIGMAKGEAVGIVKGEAIGVEKRNIEIVRNLKNMNMPIDVIVQITGLTAREIEQI